MPDSVKLSDSIVRSVLREAGWTYQSRHPDSDVIDGDNIPEPRLLHVLRRDATERAVYGGDGVRIVQQDTITVDGEATDVTVQIDASDADTVTSLTVTTA